MSELKAPEAGKSGDGVVVPDGKKEGVKVPYMRMLQLEVFKRFLNNFSVRQEILREDAIALDFVFGTPTVQHVFEIIDQDLVTVFKSDVSTRTLIRVHGQTSGEAYWIPPGHAVCQCMSYIHGKDFCKHVLAAHLKLAVTPKQDFQTMTEAQLGDIHERYLQ